MKNATPTYYSLRMPDHRWATVEVAVVEAADEAAALKIAGRLIPQFKGNYGTVARTTARAHKAFVKRLGKRITEAEQAVEHLKKFAAKVQH